MVDVWDNDSWSLRFRFIRQLHDYELEKVKAFCERLNKHSISINTKDNLVLLVTKNGSFSVKYFYSFFVK